METTAIVILGLVLGAVVLCATILLYQLHVSRAMAAHTLEARSHLQDIRERMIEIDNELVDLRISLSSGERISSDSTRPGPVYSRATEQWVQDWCAALPVTEMRSFTIEPVIEKWETRV